MAKKRVNFNNPVCNADGGNNASGIEVSLAEKRTCVYLNPVSTQGKVYSDRGLAVHAGSLDELIQTLSNIQAQLGDSKDGDLC